MATNLANAISNNDDLATVKAGAPAYLIMLDSFIEGDPNDSNMLIAAAKLYGAYSGVFVDDKRRAKRLTQKALNFSTHAYCLKVSNDCDLKNMPFSQFDQAISQVQKDDIDVLFTLGTSWAGWIQNRSDDWNAAAHLPRVVKIFQQVLLLDEKYQSGQAQLYMGVLNTLLPPALGGKPEIGQQHFIKAIKYSEGKNLMASVLYAEKYARLVFDQNLHDTLLKQVLATEPRIKSFTLTNMLAHQQAKALLASSADYF
ncbi:MAG: TRAP transporter TatT component family protein [Woeseiaceae bacterium]